MDNKNVKKILLEAFGEVSAIFMSKIQIGIDIEMPSKELEDIANKTILELQCKTIAKQKNNEEEVELCYVGAVRY